jgi:hypothetical protein
VNYSYSCLPPASLRILLLRRFNPPASCLRYSCLPPASWPILLLRRFNPPTCFLPALFLSSSCLLAYYPTTQVSSRLPASCLRYSWLPPVSWRIFLLRRFNPPCLLPACAILVYPLSLGVFSYYAGLIPLPASCLRYSCLPPPASWRILLLRLSNKVQLSPRIFDQNL